jgi:N6-adenosine-specific RNA methylase IME4
MSLKSEIAVARKHFPTIPEAIQALDRMGKQLDAAKSFDDIRKIECAADVLKKLFGHVDEVKHKAEVVILDGRARIGEELEKVPKATHRGGPKKQFTPEGKLVDGRAATSIPGTSRARLKKLAALGKAKRHAVAKELQKAGKDATVKAVLGELLDAEIKAKRKAFEQRRGRGQTIEDLNALVAEGKTFPAISLDLPWQIKTYSEKGKKKSAERYYDTMTLEEMKALPVPQLAAKDCALFMWIVWQKLPEALDLLAAWDFTYKTVAFVWVKTNKNATAIMLDGDGLFWSKGYWTRSNTEVCLLAVKGAPKRVDKNVHQVIVAPVAEHSQKPDCVHQKIEALVLGPYLELFARKLVPGWTVWGNEIEKGNGTEVETAELVPAAADAPETVATEAEISEPVAKKKRSHSKKKPSAEPVPEHAAADAPETVATEAVEELQAAE